MTAAFPLNLIEPTMDALQMLDSKKLSKTQIKVLLSVQSGLIIKTALSSGVSRN
jgi:hypothetical protein